VDFMTLSQRASTRGEVLLGGLGAWLCCGLRLGKGKQDLLEARQGKARQLPCILEQAARWC